MYKIVFEVYSYQIGYPIGPSITTLITRLKLEYRGKCWFGKPCWKPAGEYKKARISDLRYTAMFGYYQVSKVINQDMEGNGNLDIMLASTPNLTGGSAWTLSGFGYYDLKVTAPGHSTGEYSVFAQW